MDYHMLEIIACPVCYGKLFYVQKKRELICKFDSLAYPLRNGILILLKNKARSVSSSDKID